MVLKDLGIVLDRPEVNEIIVAKPQTQVNFGIKVFCIISKVNTKEKTIEDIDAGQVDFSDKTLLFVNLKEYNYKEENDEN